MKVEFFDDGVVILGDSTLEEIVQKVKEVVGGEVPLLIADPPYGNIIDVHWDKVCVDDSEFALWLMNWTKLWQNIVCQGGAFYVWGGVGKPGFRPFFRYVVGVEDQGKFELANLITWKKKTWIRSSQQLPLYA